LFYEGTYSQNDFSVSKNSPLKIIIQCSGWRK